MFVEFFPVPLEVGPRLCAGKRHNLGAAGRMLLDGCGGQEAWVRPSDLDPNLDDASGKIGSRHRTKNFAKKGI